MPDALILTTAPDSLARLHPWFEARAATCEIPPKTRYGIMVALEEAVLNVAMHAFPSGDGEISVALHCASDGLTLAIEDSGQAFDPTLAEPAPPLVSRPDSAPGGLGLTLLRHYCKDISYERDGIRNRLTLRFPRQGSESGAAESL